ncbi:MAG: hypothetical protein ACFFCM_13585 [Promethearchaeota archaeon]
MNGVLLLDRNFGECQSFNGNSSLISSFISALTIFSGEFTVSPLKSIHFTDFKIHFYKDPGNLNILYILIVDSEDDPNQIDYKLQKISTLFIEKYLNILENFNGKISQFDKFGDLLIKMNLAQKNCGGHPECKECPNREKNSKIFMAFKKDEGRFKSQIESLL